MSLYLSTTTHLRSTKRTGQSTISGESLAKQQSPHIVSIHILDDDSLLNIFYLCRPFLVGEDYGSHFFQGGERWDRGRWWYQLAHVCQRWRNLTLGSASYLRLSLVCTNGTPVENMLAHSPPLPLTVDYISKNGITAEDEEGLLLALEQRHRVRHLRLVFPVQNLRKLVMAIDEEFPILEYLIVGSSTDDGTALMLPGTLQAPNLLHLTLSGFACPIRPRLHPTAVGLVSLCIAIRPFAYFQPNVPLQWISFMPQLENLAILFTFPVPNRDVERQLTRTPITTRITLPNLRSFRFRGVSAYLEAVICLITAPRLENLQIQFFDPEQLTFSIPRLPQFMNTTENLRFDKAVIEFKAEEINVQFSRKADTYAFGVRVNRWRFDWQESAVAQISNVLSQVFSAVEDLTLERNAQFNSSEEHNDVDRIEWRNLLRSFNNVKTLQVKNGLVNELSHCLRLEDGELPLELLPELQELIYFAFRNVDDGAFTPVVDARQSGRPIKIRRHYEIPSPRSFFRDHEIGSAFGFHA